MNNKMWDAEGYVSRFSFVPAYGRELISLIEAPKGGSVVDLGCGDGFLTEALSRRGYNVVGIDASEELLRLARERHPTVTFVKGDACSFSLPQPVGTVFSNAVFHWIDADRQDEMMRCVANALIDGGELVCELGGKGNNALIHAALNDAFRRYGHHYKVPFFFPSVADYASGWERRDMAVTYAALFNRPTPLNGRDGMKEWIRMFITTPFEGIGEEERQTIIDDAVKTLRPALCRDGCWTADYVRLRLRAVKVGPGLAEPFRRG